MRSLVSGACSHHYQDEPLSLSQLQLGYSYRAMMQRATPDKSGASDAGTSPKTHKHHMQACGVKC